MQLTTKARYAVMAILEMASKVANHPITLADISQHQHIPINYLEQIFAKLRRANLVKSVKGPKGGYIINSALKDLTIANIIDAVEENIEMTRCMRKPNANCMPNKIQCNSHYLWIGLGNHIRDYFNNISIEDVLVSNQYNKTDLV